MLNHPHIYLYSKGWYKKSDNVFDDLRKIISTQSNIDEKYVIENNVVNLMIELAIEAILENAQYAGNLQHHLNKFVQNNRAKDFWGFIRQPIESKNVRIVKNCLSILSLTLIENDDLPEPDYSILPAKDYKK